VPVLLPSVVHWAAQSTEATAPAAAALHGKLDWAQDLSAASGKPVGCLCELPSQAASSAKQPKWAHRPHGGSTAAALALHTFNRI